MPKKMGVNSKAEEARARKTSTEADRKEREARDKEDQYWRDAEGGKSRAAKKREEDAEKRAEAAARKAETRRLAEQEEKEIDKAGRRPDRKANRVSIPSPLSKVTEADLQRRREEEQAQIRRGSEEAVKRQARTADEEEYERMVVVENRNRDDSVIEARSVGDAIARLSVGEGSGGGLPVDRHPERRLKASFKAFEEAELPKLKEEKPGLTHNQYKDMIWKLWKKSPDNPLNQVEGDLDDSSSFSIVSRDRTHHKWRMEDIRQESLS
ncbi:hypothetical protein Sjap_017442 [Stephania japonica]|uniref:Coiled-coil domain-containing protein n=1 Tax=Stephania japonica TaxID=461633 RepID=A0AAP0I663_9MAGN